MQKEYKDNLPTHTPPLEMSKTASALDTATPAPKQAKECPLCVEPFNRSTKKCIACPFCDYKACATCMKRVILTQSQFHCINGDFDIVTVPSPVDPTVQIRQRKYRCGLPFTRRFLAENFTLAFACTELKARRQDVLFELEQTQLPAAQAYAARRKRAQENTILARTTYKDQRQIKLENDVAIANAELEIYHLRQERDIKVPTPTSKERQKEIGGRIIELQNLIRQHVRTNSDITRGRYTTDAAQPPLYQIDRHIEPYEQEVRGEPAPVPQFAMIPGSAEVTASNKPTLSFILRCPKTTCNGYINTQTHLCGLCETHVCPQCNVETEVDAAGRTRNHTCNPTDKESYDMLKKDAKSCPRCTATIIKSEGCDHMWCSSCKTNFNWRTGEILQHSSNPEYYAYLRRMNQTIPREPGDIAGAAGQCIAGQGYPVGAAIVNQYAIVLGEIRGFHISDIHPYPHYDIVMQLSRFCEHLPMETQLQHINYEVARKSLILRAQYLNGEIDRDEFKRKALIESNRRELAEEKAAILNTFIVMATDILNRHLEFVKGAIREYCAASGFVIEPCVNAGQRFSTLVKGTNGKRLYKYPKSRYSAEQIYEHFKAIVVILMDYKLEEEIYVARDVINESLKLVYKSFGIVANDSKRYIMQRPDEECFRFVPNTPVSRKKKAPLAVTADMLTPEQLATAVRQVDTDDSNSDI